MKFQNRGLFYKKNNFVKEKKFQKREKNDRE